MKRIEFNLQSILLVFALIMLVSACKKEEPFPINIPAHYTFSGISSDNDVYAYTINSGQVEAIPESEIDMTVFDNCNQAHIIGEVDFLSETELTYLTYNLYTSPETRTETSVYQTNKFTEDLASFDIILKDDFGNEQNIPLYLENGELRLKVYCFVEESQVIGSEFEVYPIGGKGNSTEYIGTDKILERANSLEDGEKVFMMVYEQIYKKK